LELPNIRFINRKIPIDEVACKLDLRIGANGHIHCWRSDFHQHGDRTASVGIRKTNNTVKCFGCGIGPLSVVDLVRAVLGVERVREAAEWVAARFPVPEISARTHLNVPARRIFQYGSESDIGILVHSGLWAKLSPTARAIVPIMLELAEREPDQTLTVQISYLGLARFSGARSPNAIALALRELESINWLVIVAGRREPGTGPVRTTSKYILTPRADRLMELANAHCAQMRNEIELQKEMRAEARRERNVTASERHSPQNM
jgi:hypothetical protein